MGLSDVKSAEKASLLRACGCRVWASRIMRSVTFTTRTRREGHLRRRIEAATTTSKVTSLPIEQITTSGLRPLSVDANFQIPPPAWQCLSASSTERKTGWGCLEPTIRLT